MREIWRLDVAAEGDGPPVDVRVRASLKRMLRSFGLRCVDFRVVDADEVRLTDRQRKRVDGAVGETTGDGNG